MSNDQHYSPNQWPGPQQPGMPNPDQPAPHRKAPRTWVGWVVGSAAGLVLGLIMGSAGGSSATSETPASHPTVTVTQPAKPPATKTTTAPTPPAAKTTPAPKPVSLDCAGQEDKNAPCTIRVGKAFTLGKHTVLAGWKVKRDVLDDAELTGKAKNTGDDSSAMAIEVKFLKGDEVVMDVSCSTDALEPGQTQAISCYSSDDYTTKYDRVTAEAMF